MKSLFLKHKVSIIATSILFILLFGLFNFVFGIQDYEELDFVTGFVTASALNIRKGPGLNYEVIGKVYKNEFIRVFAKIGNWYVIQTDDDIIGAVSKDYVKPIYPQAENTSEDSNNDTSSQGTDNSQTSNETNQTNQNSQSGNTTQEELNLLSADEQLVFDLINNKRAENNLPLLELDEELQNVAKTKALDMVESNYFSHTSPTYGSPFDMVKAYWIKYKTCGENIAGNAKVEGAVNAWMNSEGHKANILNKNYNYTGIGVVNSPIYGKIYVQMFIGKWFGQWGRGILTEFFPCPLTINKLCAIQLW